MKVLFIAPLPPPVNGHALAAKTLFDDLVTEHTVTVVDLSVASMGDGTVSVRRIAQVGRVLAQVYRGRQADAIYLTISESLAGNIKDLFIYWLCRKRISKLFIHLHGGSIKKLLFDRHPWLYKLNARYIRRVAGIIISGQSHLEIFEGLIDPGKVHIVENFAQEDLFIDEGKIGEKFSNLGVLRILYISNMIPMKGFRELADAYLMLDALARSRIQIDFAGRFDFDSSRDEFLRKIGGVAGIRYHGVVSDSEKRRLFAEAHVFCLPTAFLEGQPISILEAYASGCVVITTGQSGIRDVFTDGVNGFELPQRNPESIAEVLNLALRKIDNLAKIAISNRATADTRYRTSGYNSRLRRIIESVRDESCERRVAENLERLSK